MRTALDSHHGRTVRICPIKTRQDTGLLPSDLVQHQILHISSAITHSASELPSHLQHFEHATLGLDASLADTFRQTLRPQRGATARPISPSGEAPTRHGDPMHDPGLGCEYQRSSFLMLAWKR